jgi:predicted nucleic acid-binding protein
MSSNCVLDSSVYVKLLIPEEDSIQVEKLFAEIVSGGAYIFVPSIFLYEVIGVFRKYGYEQEIIEEFINSYCYNPCIKVCALTAEIISESLKISGSGSKQSGFPSFYDASYHALAILNNCDFITADKKHYEKTKKLGNIKLLSQIAI